MGLFLSRKWSKKTHLEELENIEKNIGSLEDTSLSTLQRKKRIVALLIIYSILIYIIAAAVVYFCFFPTSLQDGMFYTFPLVIFPIVVVCLRSFLKWYFETSIIKNKKKLVELRAKKKKILDEVMEKETFKVAKEILEKFAPDQLPKTSLQLAGDGGSGGMSASITDGSKLINKKAQTIDAVRLRSSPQPSKIQAQQVFSQSSPPRVQIFSHQRTMQNERPLIRPIFPKSRSIIDRLVEALIGDGPNNRYALICKNCATHNGMALKEEFEYLAFRCVYCGFPNQARKTRPALMMIEGPLDSHQQEPEVESQNNSIESEETKGDIEKLLEIENSNENEEQTDEANISAENTEESHSKEVDKDDNCKSLPNGSNKNDLAKEEE